MTNLVRALVAFVAITFVFHAASAQYVVDRLYAVCYPYPSGVPQLFLLNPSSGAARAGPAFDPNSEAAAVGATTVGLNHGNDNNLYLALSNDWNYTFGGNLFVRQYNSFSSGFPDFTSYSDRYFLQVVQGGYSQPCSSQNKNPSHYVFGTSRELFALDFNDNYQTRSLLKTGSWATNLAWNTNTKTFNRLVLNAEWPFENPPNDVADTGLYLHEFDPVALTTTVRAVQSGAEWDPSDMQDNVEVSSDGKLFYMFANWVDSNEWNSGLEAIIEAGLLESTGLPSDSKRNVPLAENKEEDFVLEDRTPAADVQEPAALSDEEVTHPFERRVVAPSSDNSNKIKNSLGEGVNIHKLNVHLPGMAAPGHFYNPAYERAQKQKMQAELAGSKTSLLANKPKHARGGPKSSKSPLAQRVIAEAPYLVTLDANTFRTVEVVDMGELYCEGLTHYQNPCNGKGLGGRSLS